MISSATLRQLGPNKTGIKLRVLSSMVTPPTKDEPDSQPQQRYLHQSATTRQADVMTTHQGTQVKNHLMDRFFSTAEVTVSKIFPAGFGWQTASVVAENQGFAGDSMNFALTTGLGDAVGVLGGHYLYYTIKKAVTGSDSIDMEKELHNGILLGTAAFCSGTAWQPVVNALQGADCSFSTVFAGTFAACGAAFYGGLRIGRTLLPLAHVEKPTYENSQTDAALSTAIGGATGFFVGTDAAYLPHQNFLIGVVGIADGTADLTAAAIAGSSTSLGFCTVQSGMNVVYPAGKCWND